jgi:hypothetical protein
VQPRRREPEHDVARLAARAVDQAVALDDPDAGAGEVELLLAVDAGQLGGLAADQRAARLPADLGRALDQLGHLRQVELVGGDVVEEKQRLGAGREHVVDAVGRQVAARIPQPAGAARQHELGAHTVGRRGEQPVLVERVQAREAAEVPLDPRSPGGLRRGPQPPDDLLGRRERDPGVLVGPSAPGAHGASLSLGPATQSSYAKSSP